MQGFFSNSAQTKKLGNSNFSRVNISRFVWQVFSFSIEKWQIYNKNKSNKACFFSSCTIGARKEKRFSLRSFVSFAFIQIGMVLVRRGSLVIVQSREFCGARTKMEDGCVFASAIFAILTWFLIRVVMVLLLVIIFIIIQTFFGSFGNSFPDFCNELMNWWVIIIHLALFT